MVNGTRSDGGTANGAGVKGAVIFNIADAVYSEQVTIDSIPGTSDTSTVTFQSASGDSSKVILTYPSSTYATTKDYTLCFSKLSHFILKGITVLRDGSYAYGTTISLTGNSSYITIEHCKIISIDATGTSSSAAGIRCSSIRDSFNTYRNNYIKRGSAGISMSIPTGSSHIWPNHYTEISNNIIDSATVSVYAENRDAIKILNNIVTNSGEAISLYKCNGFVQIIDNNFNCRSGMQIYQCQSSPTKRSLIADNVLITPGAGISFSNGTIPISAYYDIVYNNIYQTGSSTSLISSPAVNTGDYWEHIRMFNNVLATTGKGPLIEMNVSDSSDHNILYVATYGGYPAGWDNSLLRSIGNYQSSSYQDSHSFIADPKFFSATDLHTKNNSVINEGIPWPTVQTDINGVPIITGIHSGGRYKTR
jgi:hypothetical protein